MNQMPLIYVGQSPPRVIDGIRAEVLVKHYKDRNGAQA